ncbi:MAG: hypothetical protein MUO39_12925 [Steroidobacteraceae bacterium]|nr:hypothetical protein [Steroidobacteraceae bacterium]
MPTHHEQHTLAVATALRELERALEQLTAAMSHQAGPASAEHAGSEQQARRVICEAWAAIDYEQAGEVNRSPVCLGVAGANAAVIARATAVNLAKSKLRDVCSALSNLRVRVPVKDGRGGRVVKSLPLVRVILRELQRSDVNLLAAYRKVPILTGRVARVVYTRACTRAVYRKTREEIAAMLSTTDRPGAEEDQAKLAALPARETHLGLVKEHYTNVRANVWFHGLDSRNRGRVQVAAELPLLYPLGRSKETPEIVYPGAEEGSAPSPRQRTGKLEDTPYLTTLPVHRYRSDLRPRPRR